MAWSTPITVATNDILSAAQYNQSIRDNLLETAPAKATSSGNWFTVSGTNQISERNMSSAVVNTSDQTTSTTYADLDSTGPSVTVNCLAAMVFISARMRNLAATDGKGAYVSVEVSGATSISASDSWMISSAGVKSGNPERMGSSHGFVLTPGDNTFTMKYKCQTGYTPAQFEQREIVVIPL
jgi:hypothetical protein